MSESDAAPRIREIRDEQNRLQKANEEAIVDLDYTEWWAVPFKRRNQGFQDSF